MNEMDHVRLEKLALRAAAFGALLQRLETNEIWKDEEAIFQASERADYIVDLAYYGCPVVEEP